MAFILNLILFFCIAVFIGICLTAWHVYASFRNMADRLKDGNRNTSSSSQQRETGRRASDDEVIIDSRTPDEANRKIFSDSEGEYVDYVEEK